MIKYNNDHPDAPLMPYIIFDTTKLEDSENKLLYLEDNLKIVNGLNRLDSTLRAKMAPTMLYGIYKNIKNCVYYLKL